MKTNKEHTFEYSVVVPLQQGSVFPERGLESIASQSIGFRENIGIVFVVPDILMIPEEYWVHEVAEVEVSYPQYDANVVNWQYERLAGGAIHGLASTAVLKEA